MVYGKDGWQANVRNYTFKIPKTYNFDCFREKCTWVLPYLAFSTYNIYMLESLQIKILATCLYA